MLILVLKQHELGKVHIFQDTYFKSSQIHDLTIMYYFEQTNHGMQLNFSFTKS